MVSTSSKPWVFAVAGVAGLVVLGLALRHSSNSDSNESSGTARKRVDAVAGVPGVEQKGWSARPGGGASKSGGDAGSLHGGASGRGSMDATGSPDGAGVGQSDRGAATTIQSGGRPGGQVGQGTGWGSSSEGAIEVAAPAPGDAGQFKDAQARLANGQGATGGAAQDQLARMTPEAGANGTDKPADGAPIVSLFGPTPSENGNVTPIESGVITDAGSAKFPLDSQMVLPDVTINNDAGAVAFCLQPQWAGSDQGDASLFQLRQPNVWDNRIQIFKNGRFLRFMVADNTGIETDPGAVIDNWQPNQPHQITGTWSSNPDGGGTAQLYIDGTLAAQRSFDGQLDIPPGTPMYIGSDYPGGVAAAQGSISNFQVYGQALPSDQIAGFSCPTGQ